jgi:hypothetical protein
MDKPENIGTGWWHTARIIGDKNKEQHLNDKQ